MRKILTIAMVLLMATMLTGCFCLHKWEEATCKVPKTCSKCNLSEGKALGHNWVDADCENPKTCEECGVIEGDALGHDWIDGDCENPKTCNTCGVKKGEPREHTLANWEAISESSMRSICTICKKEVERKLDREFLGKHVLLGKWTLTAISGGGTIGKWSEFYDSSTWVVFSENGEVEFDFWLANDAGTGTYQYEEYYEDDGTYWYNANFEKGGCIFRLDDNNDQLWWISNKLWLCFEKS